ncbi:MAG: hypothetical protein R3A80_01375 [Bdellovibrionota bacterium]
MRTFLLIVLSFSTLSPLFAEDDLFSALDSSLPIADTDPAFESQIETQMNTQEHLSNSALIASDPDFRIRDFYRRRRPSNEVKVPSSDDGERIMWKLGETMRDIDIPRGEYSLIRVISRSDGMHIRYLGKAQSDGKHLTVTESGNEIFPGDYVVKEDFHAISLPPITGDGGAVAREERSLGKVQSFLEPGQDEQIFFSGNRQLIGAKFKEYKGGNSVSIGALFTIRRKGVEVAKAVVVDADLDLATMYVYKSIREVKTEDEVFTQ